MKYSHSVVLPEVIVHSLVCTTSRDKILFVVLRAWRIAVYCRGEETELEKCLSFEYFWEIPIVLALVQIYKLGIVTLINDSTAKNFTE